MNTILYKGFQFADFKGRKGVPPHAFTDHWTEKNSEWTPVHLANARHISDAQKSQHAAIPDVRIALECSPSTFLGNFSPRCFVLLISNTSILTGQMLCIHDFRPHMIDKDFFV